MPDETPSSRQFPGEEDFDPWGGFLDAQHAWNEFGGMSVDEAYKKFIENPLSHQEDFMFMGGWAFAFYFPVIDQYLREYQVGVGPGDIEDSYAAIIGGGFSVQLLSPTSKALEPIMDQIRNLAIYVRSHTGRLADDIDEQKRIDRYWQILQTQIPPREIGGQQVGDQ